MEELTRWLHTDADNIQDGRSAEFRAFGGFVVCTLTIFTILGPLCVGMTSQASSRVQESVDLAFRDALEKIEATPKVLRSDVPDVG